jgi:hypothetical protein
MITLAWPVALFLAGFLLSAGVTFGALLFALLTARYEDPPEPGALTLEEALRARERRIVDASEIRWN